MGSHINNRSRKDKQKIITSNFNQAAVTESPYLPRHSWHLPESSPILNPISTVTLPSLTPSNLFLLSISTFPQNDTVTSAFVLPSATRRTPLDCKLAPSQTTSFPKIRPLFLVRITFPSFSFSHRTFLPLTFFAIVFRAFVFESVICCCFRWFRTSCCISGICF